MERKVWYELVEAASGRAFAGASAASVTLADSKDVDDLALAVRSAPYNDILVQHVTPAQLIVYQNREVYDDEDRIPLVSSQSISEFGRTVEDALVVEVPRSKLLLVSTPRPAWELVPSMTILDRAADLAKECGSVAEWEIDATHNIPMIWEFMKALGGCTTNGKIYWHLEDHQVVSVVLNGWFGGASNIVNNAAPFSPPLRVYNSVQGLGATHTASVMPSMASGLQLRPRLARVLWLWTALFACHRDSVALSSIHDVHGKSSGCKFTERMFADGHGPFGMGGHSTVTVNATITALQDHEVSDTITVHRLREYFDFGVVVVSYTDVDRFADIDEHTVCARNFSDPEEGNANGLLYGEFHEIDEDNTLNISTAFRPMRSGLQTVMLVPCWKQKGESFGYPVSTTEFTVYPMKDPLFCMNATVSFRNPYGYLPALLYGLFPFSGFLSLLYGFVDICFIALINRHRKSALGMQYMLLLVLLLATGESVSWFFTYSMLNHSGQRVCCPYPAMILFSTVMKIVAGMVARIATTLICLGYGIVRPKVSTPEVIVVTGLGVCYFISVGALEITHILNQSDGDASPPVVWEFLVIATNTCFTGWIFTSLALTQKNLAAFGQTAKLSMYESLKRVLFTYVLVSFFLMGLEGAVYSESILLDWQYIWLIWAANRLLMFGILLVVAVIWRPKHTSTLYATMDQLPMTPSVGSKGIEMVPQVPSALDADTPRSTMPLFDDEDEDEDEADDDDADNQDGRHSARVAL
ncbi:hypothetical protein Poli38472_003723 [Pythium oligandrum]|uniref:GOST seven transmembrane domain-containing protein n=1 Tax=Pythium oligandrum TaxID=41045 RepID=A0A8K1CN53_PYTOL|nr:hypothetical protein Poli38472_003723 [Pythium oligandrum]|eukprot:TMW65958.1 hypothetical protein Poli38472_003723 [Pythium oligandrum]